MRAPCLSFICAGLCRTTSSVYPQDAPCGAGASHSRVSAGVPATHFLLLDLSTPQVYHAPGVATRAVGSYPTLSPLPRERGGILSVALSVSRSAGPFPLGRRVLFVARTFLPGARPRSDRLTCICAKLQDCAHLQRLIPEKS